MTPETVSRSARFSGGRRGLLLLLTLSVSATSAPAGASVDRATRRGGRPATFNITMSYFRYCVEEVCTLDQFAYVRLDPPVPTFPPAADNPRGVIKARRGDRIVWTYDDPLCDFNDGPGGGPSPIQCPGHNVLFENGRVKSPLMRARAARPETFAWRVPRTTKPGTTIRYYCAPTPDNKHYQIGMTGILLIV